MDVYIFFNCDANKSEASMNISYNKTAYRSTGGARKKLFSKIMLERAAGRVKIADEDVARIEDIINNGDPVEASKFITYGAVRKIEVE